MLIYFEKKNREGSPLTQFSLPQIHDFLSLYANDYVLEIFMLRIDLFCKTVSIGEIRRISREQSHYIKVA